ncbi:c-type cytochrome domain-containing protein [Geoalkalibacter halelectricus]|uniref:DUF5666 domain-containing protein n=1 Tax=Geoalkalibacter halelectricus TaxID=2847045 RepID=A0ABY5ZKI1_9BACT|nr:c-type cytochrome domain-containing protein [Geoalkalibacter halelectricus]MDO3378009.1 DUF5666 domain-containing protein [Geoalkalibacter halelectricus]UWZ78310.1 DUF5666 domain-containing protein [Geoalkalibacter halelectricus]
MKIRVLVCAVFLLAASAAQTVYASDAPLWKDVSAILEQRCILCHQGDYASGGLRLDSLEGVLSGSARGAVVVAGKPTESELVLQVRGERRPRMPMNGPPWLSDEEVERIEAWIAAGLPGEDSPAPAAPAAKEEKAPPVVSGPLTWAQVEPVFMAHCARCHSHEGIMGPAPEKFVVTSYDDILDSRERARIIPGQPGHSEVMRRLRGQSLPRMPLDGPPWLSDTEITLVEEWIAAGARDAFGTPASVPVGARVRLEGILSGLWALDGQPFVVDGATRRDGPLRPGQRVEVRGHIGADGAIRATRVRVR